MCAAVSRRVTSGNDIERGIWKGPVQTLHDRRRLRFRPWLPILSLHAADDAGASTACRDEKLRKLDDRPEERLAESAGYHQGVFRECGGRVERRRRKRRSPLSMEHRSVAANPRL